MKAPIITLMTDFTVRDPHVGVMKGVILGICPEARVVDLTHEVDPWNLASASFLLERSYGYFPAGSIHVVVIDPGVGSSRRGLAVSANGHFFVAPDNGVLTGVFEDLPQRDSWEAFSLDAIEYRLPEVSQTFHGRDLFAPAAGHLAAGIPIRGFGKAVMDPVCLALPKPEKKIDGIIGRIVHVDRFGNLITNIRPENLPLHAEKVVIGARNSFSIPIKPTYSAVPPGNLVAVVGGYNRMEVSINQGDAPSYLGIGVNEEVFIPSGLGKKMPED